MRHSALGALVAVGLLLPCHDARPAEVAEIKLATQNGSNYLPLTVMERHNLIETHLAAKGLGASKVTWVRLAGPSAIIDGFLAGALHFSGQGLPSTALIWDRTRGGIGARAVAAMESNNIWLNTRNPSIKSLRDFTEKDRIAMPSIKTSSQALFLWMAAEKEFGRGQWGKLDHLAISLPHPEAMAAVLNPMGEINAHAATSPYADIEKKAGLHSVTDQRAVAGGTVTGLNFVSTEKFRNENPTSYAAVVAAYNEAMAWINADKKRAAQLYLDASKEKMTLDEFYPILTAPDYSFDTTPHGVMISTDVMHRAGVIKTRPQSWKDLYFPEAHQLPGD